MSKADSIPTTETAGAAAPVTLRSLADAGDKALLEISMGLEAIRTIALQIEHDGGDGAGLTFCINQIGALLDGAVQPLVNYSMGASPAGFTEPASEALERDGQDGDASRPGADLDAAAEPSREAAAAAIDAAAATVMAMGRAIYGRDGAAMARAGVVMHDAADDLRRSKEPPAGPTVTSHYAAWLQARGAEMVKLDDDAAESAGNDAWRHAQDAIACPARERWEIAHKLEILQWVLTPGDIDARLKATLFAGIAADLEG